MRFCKHGTLLYFKLLFFGELLVLHAITPEIQDVVKRQQILEDKIMKLQEKGNLSIYLSVYLSIIYIYLSIIGRSRLRKIDRDRIRMGI